MPQYRFRMSQFCHRGLSAFLPLMWLLGGFAGQTHPMTAHNDGNILYLPFPTDLARHGGITADARVHARLSEQIGDLPVASHKLDRPSPPLQDWIIVWVDAEGRPVRTNLESARHMALVTTAAPAHNELTFTYNSPSNPWTPDELAQVTATVNACYPLAKQIYGDPAFTITINIEKVANLGASGYYFSSYNGEANIWVGSTRQDTLCHEMLHGFHDDDIIGLNTFEEGMARAGEVEILNRLADLSQLDSASGWDVHHSYSIDVDYEALNKRKIGSPGAYFSAGYVAPLLRYQLSGYAWGKAVIENSNFLANFNREYYARQLADSTTWATESKLVEIAATVQPQVEGKPFSQWYSLQGVFVSNPPTGYFLYNRGDGEPGYTVDFFFRASGAPGGSETMQGNVPVDWKFYDYVGNLIDLGTNMTAPNGWAWIEPNFPEDCSARMRLRMVASAQTPDGRYVTDTVLWVRGCSGVFGVGPSANVGSLRIDSLDQPGSPPFMADVLNGAFAIPELKAVRGRFLATFTCPTCPSAGIQKFFNKDASDYFLLIDVIGDLNLDGKVDCADLALIKASFGKRFWQAGFDARADTNEDGVVDIRDLTFVGQKIPAGMRCP